MFTPEYALPEIIAQMHAECSSMLDQPNDRWAWGVAVHQLFTRTSRSWQPAFGPVSSGPDGMSTECILRSQASLTKEQASWVRSLNPPPPLTPFCICPKCACISGCFISHAVCAACLTGFVLLLMVFAHWHVGMRLLTPSLLGSTRQQTLLLPTAPLLFRRQDW